MNVLMTWDLVRAREWGVTEKYLINYFRVEWVRGGGTACCSNSGCGDWLPISIFQYIMASTQDNFYGQFSHK